VVSGGWTSIVKVEPATLPAVSEAVNATWFVPVGANGQVESGGRQRGRRVRSRDANGYGGPGLAAVDAELRAEGPGREVERISWSTMAICAAALLTLSTVEAAERKVTPSGETWALKNTIGPPDGRAAAAGGGFVVRDADLDGVVAVAIV